jgi:hypothetical protein
LKAKAISLSQFAVTTGNKITECPECKAFRQYTEEIKGSYQSRINLLEETLDYERRQSVEFKRMLFVQLGVLNKEAIQQAELETQVRIHPQVSRGKGLSELQRELTESNKEVVGRQEYWRKKELEIETREREREQHGRVKRRVAGAVQPGIRDEESSGIGRDDSTEEISV